jgi:lysine-specific demethylase/histidyl-hydroxylase NO66
MLTTMSLRQPFFRLVKDGATVPASRYTKTGRTGSTAMSGLADPARILAEFDDGASIVLQGLHRYWWPVAVFCRDLELSLGHPAQANAYITPAGSRGLGVHRDGHDVFVLQAFGTKHWEVWDTGSSAEGPPMMSVDLEPGDCLYMPKGTPHGARTQDDPSGHLTVGVTAVTWSAVVADVLTSVRAEAGLEQPLPIGFHRDPRRFGTELGERLTEVGLRLEKVDAMAEASRLSDRFLSTRPPVLRGALGSRLQLASLDDRTTVRRRPAAVCELRRRGDRLRVLLGDRYLDMPAWVEPAMGALRDREAFAVGDLTPFLRDPESRAVLVRRLVREGLLDVVGEA